jgi:hypothetical protein
MPNVWRTPGNPERRDELNDGDAAGDECERRADPGKERPFIGEGEAKVRFLFVFACSHGQPP